MHLLKRLFSPVASPLLFNFQKVKTQDEQDPLRVTHAIENGLRLVQQQVS